MSARAPRRFTGWHMTAIFIGFFAVVVGVNILMATLAVRGFGGTVVDNSYVASQNYNRWLAEARRDAALGWRVAAMRGADGRVLVSVTGANGAPWQGSLSAEATPVVARGAMVRLAFEPVGPGRWRSRVAAPLGRHRLMILLVQGDIRVRQVADLS